MFNLKSKLLGTAALLPVVAAAGLLGSADSAQAITFTSNSVSFTLGEFINAGQNGITLGDKKFVYDSSANLDLTDSISIEFSGPDYVFYYNLLGTSRSVNSFSFDYLVNVLDPNYKIKEVDNDSTVPTFAPQENLTTTFTGASTVSLVSLNGSENLKPIAPSSSVLVENTYNSFGGSIFSFQNSFHQVKTTPEPTTMLGLGLVASGMLVARRRKAVKA